MSPLISLLIRGLSIYRWSNFARIENPTTLDHSAFTLIIAYLLADLLEESDPKLRIDRLEIYRHSLFLVFFTCIYSDIGSEVKSRIRESEPGIYETLCKKAERKILSGNLPKEIVGDLRGLADLHLRPPSLESGIFEYSKLASAYFEANFNARVYPEMYGEPLEKICSNLNEERFARFRILLNVTEEGPLVHFLLTVRRLQSSYRWNRIRRAYPVSVMSHFYLVSVLSFLLVRMEGLSDADLTEAILRALSHDVPEAITGDIITPTKKAAPGLDRIIARIEVDFVNEKILHSLEGHRFKDAYKNRFLEPWGDDLGKVVKLADHLSAYIEARIEELTNPTEEQFRRSREAVGERIRSTKNQSAITLLEELEEKLRIFVPDSFLEGNLVDGSV